MGRGETADAPGSNPGLLAGSSPAAPANLEERFDEILKQVEPIQGWCQPNAGAMLYSYVLNWPHHPTVVELGSWKGLSTAWMALACKDRKGGTIYAVDTWEGTQGERVHAEMLDGKAPGSLYSEFCENIRSLGVGLREYGGPRGSGDVVAIKDTTERASRGWNTPIDILHVDASHEYKAVREDFERWSPHVKRLIVFDDVPEWPGPSRLVQELPRWWRYAGSGFGKWWVERV